MRLLSHSTSLNSFQFNIQVLQWHSSCAWCRNLLQEELACFRKWRNVSGSGLPPLLRHSALSSITVGTHVGLPVFSCCSYCMYCMTQRISGSSIFLLCFAVLFRGPALTTPSSYFWVQQLSVIRCLKAAWIRFLATEGQNSTKSCKLLPMHPADTKQHQRWFGVMFLVTRLMQVQY